jgi:hypothetical protein
MKAHALKQIDKEYDMHLQAWLNNQVKATKEVGKKYVPIYEKFKDFFDYEERINQVQSKKKKITPDMKRKAKAALMANKERG